MGKDINQKNMAINWLEYQKYYIKRKLIYRNDKKIGLLCVYG